MPRNIDPKLNKRAKRVTAGAPDEFIRMQKDKARKQRKGKVRFKELRGKRSIRQVIRESAAGRKYMIIKYKKQQNNKVKKYKVAPYSYRYRISTKTKTRKKALYAYDFSDKHIKGFYVSNILSAERTNSSFQPKWRVEITL